MNQNNYDDVPDELISDNRWLCYKLEFDEKANRWKKPPHSPRTGRKTDPTKPLKGFSFETACNAVDEFGLDGIGIMLGNNLNGIDIDDCVVGGVFTDLAKDIISIMGEGCYIEYSPSGEGVHILFYGEFEDNPDLYIKNESIGLEIYSNKRYLTVSGNTIQHGSLMVDCSEKINTVREKYMQKHLKKSANINSANGSVNGLSDNDLIRKAKKAKNGVGEIFARLWDGDYSDYPSQSEADNALCKFLAFWTGKDEGRIDRLFRLSGLMRDKWERADYRTNTIKKACAHCKKVYIPSQSHKNRTQRKEDVPNFYNDYRKFQHNVFGDFILDSFKFAQINDILHVYLDGIYVRASFKVISKITINLLPELTTHQRKEVHEYLKVKCDNVRKLSPSRFIPLKSKIYDLEEEKLIDYSSEYVFINKIPRDLKKVQRQESVVSFLKQLADYNNDIVRLILELIGYCLYRRCIYRGSAMLHGGKGCGKTSFLNLLKQFIGEENISVLSLQDFSEKFRIKALYGKLVNIGDDIPPTYINNASFFNKAATGGDLIGEDKFGDTFVFKNLAKMFFSANELPKVNDKAGAFGSRIRVIPFNHDFYNDPNFDPHVLEKTWSDDELDYLLVCALKGLKRLITQKEFTDPTEVRAATILYEGINNPIKMFLDDYGSVENQFTDDVYSAFEKWCLDEKITASAKNVFSRWVCNLTGVRVVNSSTRIDGKQKKRYVK